MEDRPVDEVAREAAFRQLRRLLGSRFSTAETVRAHHGKDESWHPPRAPEAVCFPASAAEIVEIVRLCAGGRIPIIPFGAGTSLEGHLLAERGGICVDLARMNRVVQVNAQDMDATVEAGVTRKQLDRHLRDTGLFFPVDPGADATLGGMASTRASGTNAVRYGTMRENVLALSVVLADGRLIRTARRARKSAAGYDLTRLFVGAEGTLGIITEVTVRLSGVPEASAAAVVSFSHMEAAVNAVISTIQIGIPVARIELLDQVQLDAVNRFSGLNYPLQPTLFLEFHGSSAGVQEQALEFGQIARELGGSDFLWETSPEARAKLWKARHDAYYAALALRPGSKGWVTDVCVPISRLAECILATKQDVDASFLKAPLVGHVGDGNFHLAILVDPEQPGDLEEARRLNDRLIRRALAMDGTCTGEHGIGLGKRRYLEAEHGEGVAVMRAIKEALDPHNIMNPGKLVDMDTPRAVISDIPGREGAS
ncbi:MAG: FAD-linked oxidase C-terminal domain-containing protein [Acidobacteriota bacterium]